MFNFFAQFMGAFFDKEFFTNLKLSTLNNIQIFGISEYGLFFAKNIFEQNSSDMFLGSILYDVSFLHKFEQDLAKHRRVFTIDGYVCN